MASPVSELEANGQLFLTGELVLGHVQATKDNLLQGLAEADSLEIDLSGVTRLDTAGVQLLLMLQREAKARGKTLRLRRPSAAVSRVCELLRLSLFAGQSRTE